jgi:hypothetical protein
MPVGAIRGPEAEKTWSMAKAAAKKQYPGLESKDKDKFFAIVMTIYKSMCKNKSCSPKRESMSVILGRLELIESRTLPSTYEGWLLNEPVDRDSAALTKRAIGELRMAVKEASAELLKGMKERAKNVGRGVLKISKDDGIALSKVWKKHVQPVLDNGKYEPVGFLYPEPRVIAGQKLIDVIKEFYGVKGFTNLGDYI